LKEALQLISQVAIYINETIRHHEMDLEIVEIQKGILGLSAALDSTYIFYVKKSFILTLMLGYTTCKLT